MARDSSDKSLREPSSAKFPFVLAEAGSLLVKTRVPCLYVRPGGSEDNLFLFLSVIPLSEKSEEERSEESYEEPRFLLSLFGASGKISLGPLPSQKL